MKEGSLTLTNSWTEQFCLGPLHTIWSFDKDSRARRNMFVVLAQLDSSDGKTRVSSSMGALVQQINFYMLHTSTMGRASVS